MIYMTNPHKIYLYEKRSKCIDIGETCLNILFLLERGKIGKELDENIKRLTKVLKKMKERDVTDFVIKEVRKELIRKINYDEKKLSELVENVISDLKVKKMTNRVRFLLEHLLDIVMRKSIEAIQELYQF